MTTLRKFSIALPITAVLAFAASAHATIYCVNDSGCPAGGVAKSTVADAVVAANAGADHDTIKIGSGTYSSPPAISQPTDIVGAGSGSTEIDRGPGIGPGIDLLDGQSQVTDLTVHLGENQQSGIVLLGGASAHRVRVVASHALTSVIGVLVEQPVSDISQVTIDLGDDLSNYGIFDIGGATVSDADITAGRGIAASDYGTIVRRAIVRGIVPLNAYAGILNIANALVLPHPDSTSADGFYAIDVENGNSGKSALLNAADVTIAGAGYGTGLSVYSNYAEPGGNASANVSGLLVSGVDQDIYRHGKSLAETANVKVDHSAYDAASVQEGGEGSFVVGAGNLTTGPDPAFVNPAAGDYRLRSDSPLIDKGPSTEPLSNDDPDLTGQSRVLDGDGNGSAIRDIGAYEYQPSEPAGPGGGAPSATATAPAAAPVLSGLTESARRWSERNKLPHFARAKIGTTFRFELNQPAKVRFVFSRSGKRKGAIAFSTHAGASKLRFLGRISKKRKLRPGRYKVTVTATNAAGKRSAPKSLSFKIAR